MAILTTGSTIFGLQVGMDKHLKGSGCLGAPQLTYVLGTPNGVVTNVNGSDIAVDFTNGNYYIAKTPAGGSTWYKLVSGT